MFHIYVSVSYHVAESAHIVCFISQKKIISKCQMSIQIDPIFPEWVVLRGTKLDLRFNSEVC